MKKLFIINDASGSANQYGIGTFKEELLESLIGVNCSIQTVDVNSNCSTIKNEKKEYFNHLCFPKANIKWDPDNYRYYRNIGYYLASLVNKEEEVAFHFNYLNHWIIAFVLKKLLPKAKQLLTIHYLEERIEDKEKTFFQIADYIVVLCEDTYHLIRNFYGISASKVHWIVNGIKDRNHTSISKIKESLRKKYEFTKEEKLLLFVGRLCEQKGVDLLLESAKSLIDKDKNVHLILVGSGDEAYYRKLSIGYWRKIHFWGQQERNVVFELYQICDCGIFPSLQEQFGYVAIEMMMFGLPVVAFAEKGGLKDIFHWEGIRQYIAPFNDISLLTKKIEWVLEQNKKDSDMFRKCFLQHYQNDKLKAYWELYFNK